MLLNNEENNSGYDKDSLGPHHFSGTINQIPLKDIITFKCLNTHLVEIAF